MSDIIKKPMLVGIFFATLLCAQGCVPLMIGAGVGAGAAAGGAAEERGLSGALTDAEIRARINMLWYQHSKKMHGRLSSSVREGRVLLTGVLDTEQAHLDAVRLTWQCKGVREVIDEIKVSNQGNGLGDYTRDGWITAKLKSKMLFDKDIPSRNYSVMTVGAVVYVMGIAQNRKELEYVTNHARNISGVRRVVSYARVKAEPLPHI